MCIRDRGSIVIDTIKGLKNSNQFVDVYPIKLVLPITAVLRKRIFNLPIIGTAKNLLLASICSPDGFKRNLNIKLYFLTFFFVLLKSVRPINWNNMPDWACYEAVYVLLNLKCSQESNYAIRSALFSYTFELLKDYTVCFCGFNQFCYLSWIRSYRGTVSKLKTLPL